MIPSTQLARKISLPLLIFYGLGVILGAGIYVLVGKVAGEAGVFAPLSFVIAAGIATITAFSYTDLVGRFPKSAGEVVYVKEGLNIRWLSQVVGWLVVLSGVISSATILNGFSGYMKEFLSLPDYVIITVVVVILTIVAAWGVAESMWVAATMTCIELLGLMIVLFYTTDVWVQLPDTYRIHWASFDTQGVFLGAFLAFFAFVGFEDMVNVVEEVKEPAKNMTRAILTAVVISTVLYVLIAMVSIAALPLEVLAASEAPLAHIVRDRSAAAAKWVSLISLFAVVNGALIQIVMGSRVLYGMAQEKLAPSFLSTINSKTKTPVKATVILASCILGFALWLPIVTLAKFTSFAVLTIFVFVNISLCSLRVRESKKGKGIGLKKSFWPLCGALSSLLLMVFQVISG